MPNNTFLFFTSMDFQHNPLIIFKTGSSNPDLYKKIALQAFTGSLGSKTSSEPVGESILLNSEEKVLAFSYVFSYNHPNLQKSGVPTSALILAVQESDRLQ